MLSSSSSVKCIFFSFAVMKSSSSVTSKKMVQARLPFKWMNPAPKEKEENLEKKLKVAPKHSPPHSMNLCDTSIEDTENNCEIEVRLPKAINGKGPLDQYLKKTLKVNLPQPTITIDLTEDSDSGQVGKGLLPEETRTLLTNGALSPNKPSSLVLTTETDKCEYHVATPEQGQSTEPSSTGSMSPVPMDRQEFSGSPDVQVTASDKASLMPPSGEPMFDSSEDEELQAEKSTRELAREEAKAAKERVREEAKKKRDEEKELKEKERREKKEREDKEKAEKLRIKEEKKKEKMENTLFQRVKAEKAEITKFFQKPKTPQTPKIFASFCGKFAPFEIKKNMAVAPLCRVAFESEASEQLDRLLKEQNYHTSFLLEIKARKPKSMGQTVVPQVVQILEDPVVDLDGTFMLEEPVNKSTVPERQRFGRMKLLQFCENYRPAYWGTWNRRSRIIASRKPWAQDTKILDYEMDSDEEWEEEEPGESLSHSEGVSVFMLVSDDLENQKVRQRLKAKEWDELQSKGKRFRVLQPVIIGCIWQESNAAEIRLLKRFATCILESPLAEEELTQEISCNRNLKDRQILSQLLPLLHGNVNGSKTIIQEFQEYCRQGLFSEGESNVSSVGLTSNSSSPNSAQQTPITVPSKACLKRLISENSVYEKRPEHRMCWYVHLEVLKNFEKANLPVPCQWTYITQVNSSKEDCGVPAGSMPTVSSKRKSAGSMPITKFMKRARDTVIPVRLQSNNALVIFTCKLKVSKMLRVLMGSL
uniref:Chromatin assembly factor 1 subunit A n=1 Tax=Leptobrachium leishanense TaxID=445787 RepID=A0A8C5PB38_9ANUR